MFYGLIMRFGHIGLWPKIGVIETVAMTEIHVHVVWHWKRKHGYLNLYSRGECQKYETSLDLYSAVLYKGQLYHSCIDRNYGGKRICLRFCEERYIRIVNEIFADTVLECAIGQRNDPHRKTKQEQRPSYRLNESITLSSVLYTDGK